MNDLPLYKDFVVGAVDAELKRMLSECTTAQVELFQRLYPDGPTYEQLPVAYDQVRRTVIRNREKRTNEARNG